MRRIWPWLRVGIGSVLVAAAAGSGVVAFGPRSSVLKTPSAAATVETTVPSTEPPISAPPVAPSPLPALPQPADAPADPYAAVPIVPIAQLVIPKLGIDVTVHEGIWLTVLDQGPGHWPGSAEPGQYGNTVIAAHRVTHSHPFRHIDLLAPGDSIILRTAKGTFTYAVTGSQVVTPADMWIVAQHPGHTITLFACHPPGSARYRYVVTGELVSSTS
jgi:sortase A